MESASQQPAAPKSLPTPRRVGSLEVLYCDGATAFDGQVHDHDKVTGVFVTAGIMSNIDDSGSEVDIGPGALHFMPAGASHIHLCRTPSIKRLWFGLDESFIDQLGSFGRTFAAPFGVERGPATSTATKLYRELAKSDTASNLVVQGLILEMVGAVVQPAPSKPAAPPDWLRRAVEMLNDLHNVDLRVEDISQEVGVHPTHLIRVFREVMGTTPGAYVRELRMRHAARDVAFGTAPFKNIARKYGFANPSHFATAFLRHYGISPTQMRGGVPSDRSERGA